MALKKDEPKGKVAKGAKKGQQGTGYGQEVRKAKGEEKKAFRQAGGRKEAKKGTLVGIYDEGKGARLYNTPVSNVEYAQKFVKRTNTKSEEGLKSAKQNFQNRAGGSSASEIARQENADFYGATRFGRRMVKKASKANPGISTSGGFSTATSKKKK
jgi:hypothetical protein